MRKTALEVMQGFQEGMGSGTDVWKSFIAEDIVFQGPVDTVHGKEAFIALNEGFMPAIRGYEYLRGVEQGDTLATEVKFVVATPSGRELTLEMAEFYVVKEGKIQSIKVFYDAEEFRKAMQVDTPSN